MTKETPGSAKAVGIALSWTVVVVLLAVFGQKDELGATALEATVIFLVLAVGTFSLSIWIQLK